VGCVPSKTLIRAAETLHQARTAGRFAGIEASAGLADWSATLAQKDELVGALRQAKYKDLLAAYERITYVEGRTRFAADGILVSGEPLRAGKVVITTGARPALPSVSGIADLAYLTSTTVLEMEELPHSLLIIGGGYVGCELAQIFARAGVAVTIACRRGLLPEAEPEIGAALTEYFQIEGIAVRSGLQYRQIRQTEAGALLNAHADGGDVRLEAERVLIASGRRPNTEEMGLAEAGVALLPNSGIEVDDRLRTTRAGVYAAGDVTGRDQFVYMAAYGARRAAENALNGDNRRYDNAAMPAVVFTDPQVASVGLTEAAARQAGHRVKTSLLPLDQVPRALAARDTRGLIKLVADEESNRLLGAHTLAPEGADSIQTAVLAIKHGLTVTDLAETIFPYLTTVEGLKLAAQSFTRDVARLSCCAG
ncbi:MAG: mercury(II) reductase, partial [Acetobacterales bacterium]